MVVNPALAQIFDSGAARPGLLHAPRRPSRSRRCIAWSLVFCWPSRANAGRDVVDRAIAVENKWRAQRYGVQGTFITRSGGIAIGEMLDAILEHVAADADALDCAEQMEHCRAIILGGTSADVQLSVFAENQRDGAETAFVR